MNQTKSSRSKVKNKTRSSSKASKTKASKPSGNKKSLPRLNPKDVVFAMDIGTHSVIGMLGRRDETRMEVLEIYEKEYPVRAMLDGQIQDIEMVAKTAREVKDYLAKSGKIELTDVYVAAAGRTLRTVESSSTTVFDEPVVLNDDLITRINSSAIAKAEEVFMEENGEEDGNADEYYLSGYSIGEYIVDGYPMTNIREHHAKEVVAKAIVTFLPRQVVESLYTTMTKIGLEVSGLTLEPIAAMNAAIPPNIRLLNIALVDVGAGTSDIAISRDGSVVGYTMVTVAGDEITEAIMKKLLTDFDTAEAIKVSITGMTGEDTIKFSDVLGMEKELPYDKLLACIQESEEDLARDIAQAILSININAPSAVFLVGGGSRLGKLDKLVAKALNMDETRVAMGGSNFEKSAYSLKADIKNPAYATVLGILLSAGFNMNNEGFFVKLNDRKCRLFRSGTITVFDILMMNGYSHRDLFARKGDSLTIYIDGVKKILSGEMSSPARILVNGEEAKVTTILSAGDRVDFTPAKQGADASYTLSDVIGDFSFDSFEVFYDETTYLAGSFLLVNGKPVSAEEASKMIVEQGSVIQRASVYRIGDFINLYHPDQRLRIEGADTEHLSPGYRLCRDEQV